LLNDFVIFKCNGSIRAKLSRCSKTAKHHGSTCPTVGANCSCMDCEWVFYASELCIRYPSVSLSFTSCRNEKVEQHIRKKTHKPFVGFGLKGNFPYVGLAHVSLLWDIFSISLQFSKQVTSDGLWRWSTQKSIIWFLYWKPSWRRFQANTSW